MAEVPQDALDRMRRWPGKRGWTKCNDDPHAEQHPAQSANQYATMAFAVPVPGFLQACVGLREFAIALPVDEFGLDG